MRAAVVTGFDRPVEVREVPLPEPGPGQVRVRIEACGLCHTDVHAARGDWPVRPQPPFVPGHEGVGVVEKAGAGVTRHAVGDRVAIPWLERACGVCEYCVTGWETICARQLDTGYAVDGGHAEFAVAGARYVVGVPDGLDPAEAAPLTCAGVTGYRAVLAGGVGRGDRVAVFGIDGTGHLALQYAGILGGECVAVDVTEENLVLAKGLGAAHVVNAAETDPISAIGALGGADVAVVLAPGPRAAEQAHASLRRGGRLVLASPPGDDGMPVFQPVLKDVRVFGSIVGTRADLVEVFRLHAAGRARVRYETRPLDRVNESIEDLLAGRVPASLVLLP
ncbi:zinc-dependent alcohol dehydrogenase [Actinoplanes sp. NPDC049668]|uniref:alcohol dehydrogenase catalytic domain-containing protein n=1 Tax=unclassified Actinoplanes TaxID=2626549 RepID=UPI0033AA3356